MRENIIKIDAFDVISIVSYRAENELSKQGKAVIKAIIKDKKESEYIDIARRTNWVKVTAVDENEKEKTIFFGLLKSIKFGKESGSSIMELELVTGTCLMENKKHIRSFGRNEELNSILDICKKEYENSHYIMGDINNKALGFTMQYRENDWEFIKRLAASKKTVIIPDYHTQGVKYYFGLPERDIKPLTSNDFRLVINRDYIMYEVGSREIYKLGDRLKFNEKVYTVSKVISQTLGNELYHTYYLVQDIAYILKEIDSYNSKLIGVSLSAGVTKVGTEQVMVSIDEDENTKDLEGIWFSFSTVYSSSNGAGWYCMPEKGDKVRLYFPTEKEADAYVCSAVHEDEGSGIRNNPENKIWRNKYGKEIRLTPDSISITNNMGDYIEISDDEGIKIVSKGNISIRAKDTIEISSEDSNISLTADKRIMLLQEDTQIILKDGIIVSGNGVNIS